VLTGDREEDLPHVDVGLQESFRKPTSVDVLVDIHIQKDLLAVTFPATNVGE